MNISSLNYNNSYKGYLVQIISFEPLANFLKSVSFNLSIANFLIDKATLVFTKMLFEVSGTSEFIHELTKDESHKLLNYFTQFLPHLESLHSKSELFKKNEKLKELHRILFLLSEKVRDNICLLEDHIHTEYAYNISMNHADNDWNDPINDHWDNY